MLQSLSSLSDDGRGEAIEWQLEIGSGRPSLRGSVPIGVSCRLERAWSQKGGNEVGASGGALRLRRALPRKACGRGRHCLLTTAGLIVVMRRECRAGEVRRL